MTGGTGTPDVSTQRLATKAAAIVTMMTRRYCMKATSRLSAPKADAIRTMAVEAPGAEPQTAVVPGRMRSRLIDQPRKLDAATVDTTAIRMMGQSAAIVVRMASSMEPAMMQPISVCEALNASEGTRTVKPPTPQAMATSIGPMRKAAGRCAHSRAAATRPEPAARTTHCTARGSADGWGLSLSGDVIVAGLSPGAGFVSPRTAVDSSLGKSRASNWLSRR